MKNLKALRKNIKHWCVDIRMPSLRADAIIDHNFWKNKKEIVEMHSDDCGFCIEYLIHSVTPYNYTLK